jgi:hypothetical protein|tara:strand:+ start:1798 stop:2055 length:258 start_codon:yes stop_codon:yes gene_type:complete
MEIEKIIKTPAASKKFIYAAVMSFIWMGLIGLAIWTKADGAVLESMVWVSGLISSLYLGGQSMVDSLVKAALVKSGGLNNGTDNE